jgi:hypothetical protein
MQEILSKTSDPKARLRDQEFYESRLFEKRNRLAIGKVCRSLSQKSTMVISFSLSMRL